MVTEISFNTYNKDGVVGQFPNNYEIMYDNNNLKLSIFIDFQY